MILSFSGICTFAEMSFARCTGITRTGDMRTAQLCMTCTHVTATAVANLYEQEYVARGGSATSSIVPSDLARVMLIAW